jgi:hypothetical protein
MGNQVRISWTLRVGDSQAVEHLQYVINTPSDGGTHLAAAVHLSTEPANRVRFIGRVDVIRLAVVFSAAGFLCC